MMLFKMLGIEEAYRRQQAEHETNLPRPRQVFITLSGVLVETVQAYYSKLVSSAAAARGEETHGLQAEQADAERGLVDRDEEGLWYGTLPACFSELQDEHFPLFVTFDHVCSFCHLLGLC